MLCPTGGCHLAWSGPGACLAGSNCSSPKCQVTNNKIGQKYQIKKCQVTKIWQKKCQVTNNKIWPIKNNYQVTENQVTECKYLNIPESKTLAQSFHQFSRLPNHHHHHQCIVTILCRDVSFEDTELSLVDENLLGAVFKKLQNLNLSALALTASQW